MKLFNTFRTSVAVLIVCTVTLAGSASAATAVDLGTADGFAILGGAGITIGGAVNTSTLTGDIGTFPTATITGLGNAVLNGTNHAGDATTQAGKTALTAAFAAAGQVPTTIITELGGATKTAGVYDSLSGTFEMTGTLTLDGEGDPNAVFIFRTGTTLVTAGASSVTLIRGAQACNVFWQVGSSATLGASSFFKGNILADQSVGLGTNAQVEGRVLAQTGSVTLDGTNVITRATCVVPPPPPAPVPSAGSGGGTFAPLPLINVTKIPSPLALPGGPGSVTYTYTATNVGPVAMRGVWVRDNKCDAVTFISGDTDTDSLLDANESWVYRCTKTVSETETNTATAHGQANGWDAYDTANATVVVGVALTPPLIHLVKVPSVFVLPAGGGAVTYAYSVTNPGAVSLSDVSIVDDKCTGLPARVVGHPGDINKNDLLDPGETFHFTCLSLLTQTTTNIGTAEGHANGLTAIDFSPATVVVAAPGLPSTGLSPEGRSMPLGIAVLSAILMAVLASLGFVLRKQNA